MKYMDICTFNKLSLALPWLLNLLRYQAKIQ